MKASDVLEIDAQNLHYRVLNEKLRELIKEGAKHVLVKNVCGQRYIGDAVGEEAEIVIEGVVLPCVREEEGPFGEFTDSFVPVMENHVFHVRALTRRKVPLYHTIFAGGEEDLRPRRLTDPHLVAAEQLRPEGGEDEVIATGPPDLDRPLQVGDRAETILRPRSRRTGAGDEDERQQTREPVPGCAHAATTSRNRRVRARELAREVHVSTPHLLCWEHHTAAWPLLG